MAGPPSGSGAVGFLSEPGGRNLVTSPRGTRPSVLPDDPVFQRAAHGHAAMIGLVHDRAHLRTYQVFPVRSHGRIVAVLGIGVTARGGGIQQLMEQIGTLGLQSAGWSLVSSDGIAFASYDFGRVDKQLADPSQLRRIRPGHAADVSSHSGEIVLASPISTISRPTAKYLVFSQPADLFYRDIRRGHAARDRGLAAVVLAATIGLALVNHRREQAIRRSERRLDVLLQHAHDVVIVLDRDERASFVSSAMTGQLGYARDGISIPWLAELAHPDDRLRVSAFAARMRTNVTASIIDVRIRDTDGRYHWFDIDAVDLRDHREIAGTLLTCHVTGERKALERALSNRAEHDPLTGLPNRATFAARLEELAAADDAGPFAVLFVDLDHFKPVNDSFGHDVGDEVLRMVSDRLVTSVRSRFRYGDHAERPRAPDFVCRLGGDEFALLLLDVSEDMARATADRVLAAVAQPFPAGDTVVHIGATIGVAMSQPDQEHPETTVREADMAMYDAKVAGRGRYAMFAAPA
jgi:diguanylate cyclase (GGDEF)-like protein/PAS domain S-box-containing protein